MTTGNLAFNKSPVALLGGRLAPGVTILWCETKTPPICGEYLTFFTLFGRSHIWTKNPLIFRRGPFFFFGLDILLDQKPTYFAAKTFFWSSPIFGTKKGATTKSHPAPQVPPFLAMPLQKPISYDQWREAVACLNPYQNTHWHLSTLILFCLIALALYMLAPHQSLTKENFF